MTLRVMYELKRIGPASCGRALGIIAAAFYAILSVVLIAAGKTGNIDITSSNGAVTLALGMVLTAAAGAVIGAVAALIYNLLGRRGGGLRLTFRLLDTDKKPEDKTKK